MDYTAFSKFIQLCTPQLKGRFSPRRNFIHRDESFVCIKNSLVGCRSFTEPLPEQRRKNKDGLTSAKELLNINSFWTLLFGSKKPLDQEADGFRSVDNAHYDVAQPDWSGTEKIAHSIISFYIAL